MADQDIDETPSTARVELEIPAETLTELHDGSARLDADDIELTPDQWTYVDSASQQQEGDQRLESASEYSQKVILCVLIDQANHPIRGRAYVQKLVFLLQQRAGADWFSFEPGDYGPFADDLYETVDHCIRRGYLEESTVEDENGKIRYHYTSGPNINDLLTKRECPKLEALVSDVVDDNPTDDLHELVKTVFSKYPAWSRNSIY